MLRENPLGLLLDRKGFAFETGMVFRGLSVTQREDGFNVVLRARRPNGDPVYCMTLAESPYGGLKRLWEGVTSGGGAVLWHFDRFAL